MPPVLISKLTILIVLWGAQKFLRPPLLLRVSKIIFLISVIGIFAISAYWTYWQYQIWDDNEMTKIFLPPHRGIGYFIQYAFTNFYFKELAALGSAILALFLAKLLNKRFRERFFWPAEPWILATAILLIGHPWFLVYLPGFFVIYLLLTGIYSIFRKGERVSPYYLWIPVALITLMLGYFRG
ncbi:MAG: hypothetical protein HYT03_03500 [Candidatus Harrisonbacteria bacterium]|nr:hypothetical protein [Candidatus Harrisonbacteria bacterium]